jgi:hypothetical protein
MADGNDDEDIVKNCPKCGATYPSDEAKFCSECGVSRPVPKVKAGAGGATNLVVQGTIDISKLNTALQNALGTMQAEIHQLTMAILQERHARQIMDQRLRSLHEWRTDAGQGDGNDWKSALKEEVKNRTEWQKETGAKVQWYGVEFTSIKKELATLKERCDYVVTKDWQQIAQKNFEDIGHNIEEMKKTDDALKKALLAKEKTLQKADQDLQELLKTLRSEYEDHIRNLHSKDSRPKPVEMSARKHQAIYWNIERGCWIASYVNSLKFMTKRYNKVGARERPEDPVGQPEDDNAWKAFLYEVVQEYSDRLQEGKRPRVRIDVSFPGPQIPASDPKSTQLHQEWADMLIENRRHYIHQSFVNMAQSQGLPTDRVEVQYREGNADVTARVAEVHSWD